MDRSTCRSAPCGIRDKRINPQGVFFFSNFKEQIVAKTNPFSYYLLVFVFAIGANFSQAMAARAFLPPTPSFRRTRAEFGKVCEIASAISLKMGSC